MRPIAVGNTLFRLVAKIGMAKLSDKCKELFWPNQVGVGSPLGAEVAVHSVRKFLLSPSSSDMICLKTDFRNAYNTLRQDIALKTIEKEAYGKHSYLFLGQDDHIMSREGVQQGDPLDPFIYALTTMSVTKSCQSPLNVFYLDDGFIAGPVDTVVKDYNQIMETSKSLGLELNLSKSELSRISALSKISENAISKFPGVQEISANELKLLSAPILPEANEEVLQPKLESLQIMVDRLKLLRLFLLRQCFCMPKIMYSIRTAPIFRNTVWCEQFDETIRLALQRILNVQMEGSTWEQSSLPISMGGLGIRKASEVAVPAYLSSVRYFQRSGSNGS